jgi:hypothetical protein
MFQSGERALASAANVRARLVRLGKNIRRRLDVRSDCERWNGQYAVSGAGSEGGAGLKKKKKEKEKKRKRKRTRKKELRGSAGNGGIANQRAGYRQLCWTKADRTWRLKSVRP